MPITARRWTLVLAAVLLGLVAAPHALAQDPAPDEVVTVQADAGGQAPNPDPAPAPTPAPAPASQPSSSGGSSSSTGSSSSSSSSGSSGGSSSSGSTFTPSPAPSSSSAGPTAAEIAAQRAAERRRQRQETLRKKRERERRQRERERKEAAKLAKDAQEAKDSGFAAFLQAWAQSPSPDAGNQPSSIEGTADPAAVRQSATPFQPSSGGSSTSPIATAILLTLLGISIVLLGLAALPVSSIRGPTLSALIAYRRLEIGLIGAAVLASAAIGLGITLASE